MKKITLALCACAFALTGLLASCSNEAPVTSVNYIDVAEIGHSHLYAVKGTITTTTTQSFKTEADGTTPSQNGKESSRTEVITQTIDNGNVEVSWDSDENKISNLSSYTIEGEIFDTLETKRTSVKYGEAQDWTKKVVKGNDFFGIRIYVIDDEYYLAEIDQNAGDISKLTKLESYAVSEDDAAFDGDFGDEFTLTFTVTHDLMTFENFAGADFNYEDDYTKSSKYSEWKDMKDKYGAKASETKEYKLTFYPAQDFDPEAEVEEDEE